MTREQAIKLAKEIERSLEFTNEGKCVKCTYEVIADALMEGYVKGCRWHNVSEGLPRTNIWALRKNARYPILLKYSPPANRWFYAEFGYTEEGVREYYDYFIPVPEFPKMRED